MRLPILIVLSSIAACPATAKDIRVTAAPVPLDAHDPQQATVDALELVAGFVLESDAPEWGGYSGMVMAPDGNQIIAVSDVGHWLKLALRHDGQGRLAGVGRARIEPLLDEAGRPVAAKEWSDAESIAQLPGGDFIVAFERHHRLWRYGSVDGVPAGPARSVAAPEAIAALPRNAGIEAVAAPRDGRLILAAEGGADPARGSRAWTSDGQAWHEAWIERSDGFEPTDLALYAGTGLVLLERRYTEADGPAARISVIADEMKHGSSFAGDTLAVLRLPLSVDNFEAIAVRLLQDGEPSIYLLSDDNQSGRQRTLLLQFRLRPGPR